MPFSTSSFINPGQITSYRIHFGDQTKDPVSINESQRKTLANATIFHDNHLMYRNNPPKSKNIAATQIEEAKGRLDNDLFHRDNGILSTSALGIATALTSLACLTGWGFVHNHNFIKTHKVGYDNLDQYTSQGKLNDAHLMRCISAAGFLLSGGLLTLGAGVAGYAVGMDVLDLRKALKMAKKIEKNILVLEAPNASTDKSIIFSLDKWIDQEADKFAKKIQNIYQSEPETRPQLNAVFGSEQQLPTSQTIRNLFQYYVFLSLQAESASNTTVPLQNKKITELEFRKKQYALLKTANKLGELFEFITPSEKKDALFQQGLNKSLIWQTTQTMDALENRVQTLRELHNNSIEADRHIGLAQQALISAKLAEDEIKAIEIRKLVEDFKIQKQKIQEAISKVDQGTMDDSQLLEGLNDNFNHSVAYLQAVMESKKVELEATESIQNILKQKSQESTKGMDHS